MGKEWGNAHLPVSLPYCERTRSPIFGAKRRLHSYVARVGPPLTSYGGGEGG